MANVLKSFGQKVSTSATIDGVAMFQDTILTSGSGKTCTIVGINFANLTNATINVHCFVLKNTGSVTTHLIGKPTQIVSGSALFFPNKHVLESQDAIKVVCDTDDAVDVFISYLEQS